MKYFVGTFFYLFYSKNKIIIKKIFKAMSQQTVDK